MYAIRSYYVEELLPARFSAARTVPAKDGTNTIQFENLSLQPDGVILDLEMPVMDGFAFLRWMLHHHPIPVIVVSAQSETFV